MYYDDDDVWSEGDILFGTHEVHHHHIQKKVFKLYEFFCCLCYDFYMSSVPIYNYDLNCRKLQLIYREPQNGV